MLTLVHAVFRHLKLKTRVFKEVNLENNKTATGVMIWNVETSMKCTQ